VPGRIFKRGLNGELALASEDGDLRIGAFVGVCNEIELIERFLLHLRKIGVSEILVCDMNSTDGTAEFLRDSCQSESLTLMSIGVEEPAEVYLKQCEDAAKHLSSDWLLFLDADEFVLPLSGDLRDCPRLLDSDAISLRRFNVVCTPKGPRFPSELSPMRYGEVDLFVRDVPNFREQLLSDQPLPIVRKVPGRKLLVRRECLHRMTDGMHDLVAAGPNARRANTPDIVIAHLPITTRSRFMRKVESIRQTFVHHDEHFGTDKAWHWRHLLRLHERGEIDGEFLRSVFTDDQLSEFRSNGLVANAADLLAPADIGFDPLRA
jgi:hypothetical protein